ncbi:MAG: peptidoglycan endopeptidase, partial [Sphingomonas sp.]|nr:peptidoglycan endopeptidase [Sphingomonas sp.]
MSPLTAARAAIGARFRLHGRRVESGLDCVGLAGLAARAGGATVAVPSGYGLRTTDAAAVIARLDAALPRAAPPLPGDLLLFCVGPAQLHLAVLSEGGIIHADAHLRRVVERP